MVTADPRSYTSGQSTIKYSNHKIINIWPIIGLNSRCHYEQTFYFISYPNTQSLIIELREKQQFSKNLREIFNDKKNK